MRREEFADVVKLIENYWGDSFDQKKIDDWYDIFQDFKVQGLLKTIRELAREQKFSPRISDIIGKYNELRNRQMKEIREKQVEEQQRLTAGQAECDLCRNSGWVMVWLEGYQYSVRCICSHGRDLNRFSQPQLDRRVKHINHMGKEEDIYIPTVQEALTPESFAIFRAEKIAKAREAKESAEKERRLLEEAKKKIGVTNGR